MRNQNERISADPNRAAAPTAAAPSPVPAKATFATRPRGTQTIFGVSGERFRTATNNRLSPKHLMSEVNVLRLRTQQECPVFSIFDPVHVNEALVRTEPDGPRRLWSNAKLYPIAGCQIVTENTVYLCLCVCVCIVTCGCALYFSLFEVYLWILNNVNMSAICVCDACRV